MEIFDSHAHFDDAAFDEDRHQLLPRIHQEGVRYITNIGCDERTNQSSVALAEQYDFVYATVGWHPEFAGSWNEQAEAQVSRHRRDRRGLSLDERPRNGAAQVL